MRVLWRNAKEINTFGKYLMFRTDDNITDANRIQDIKDFQVDIAQGPGNRFYLMSDKGTGQLITTLDPECRFFGPLLIDEYELARDLIIGLTGGLGVLIND